jgi:PPP family 3-phenylpropionic acid transporter
MSHPPVTPPVASPGVSQEHWRTHLRARLRGPRVRLSALQGANFAGIGIYMPFMPPWLASQGLTERQIGITLALGMILRMLASPPIASLGDGRWGAVRILAILHFASACSFLALAALPTTGAIMAAMLVVAVLGAGIIPLGDHLTTAQVRVRPGLDFARIRLWGSIAFLVTSIGSGFLIARQGLGIVPYALALCALGAGLVALGAPEERAGRRDPGPASAPTAKSRSRDRLLWLAILASALINASHAALYGFGTLHWRAIGIGDDAIGILWASGIIAEIAMFWWFGKRAWRSWRMAMLFLALSGAAATLRFLAMPYATTLPQIFGLQLMHALSFGAQLMGIMAILTLLAPEGKRALMQGRLSAVNACMMGTATLASGFAYERAGDLAFIAMAPLALVGLALLLITYRLGQAMSLDSAPQVTLPVTPVARTDGARLERSS